MPGKGSRSYAKYALVLLGVPAGIVEGWRKGELVTGMGTSFYGKYDLIRLVAPAGIVEGCEKEGISA